MNQLVFSFLRKVNRHVKVRRKQKRSMIMSPVRRIEFVAPPKERMCAMTFDDGPTAAPCLPSGRKCLTEHILDVLKNHGATATFNVIGSTAENYPDFQGKLGTHHVFGTKYDHYACFSQDHLAGALSCTDLLKRLVSDGHEIANHGYRHIIFGAEYFVYRKREFFKNLDEVVADLSRLHDFVKSETGYEINLARPPHYVDRIGRFSKSNAYTAYAKMRYHYLAASVDGGGYLPTCGNYDKDVKKMVAYLEKLLDNDPNSLSGQIIFQKDGYNMSMESPVADALELQLALLKKYSYKVVTVSELMSHSPFEDVNQNDEGLEAIRELEKQGFAIGFQNNEFRPNERITKEQLIAMCTKRENIMPTRIRDKNFLSEEEIYRTISEKLGGDVKISCNTRRGAAMAIWEAICKKA